MNQSAQFAQPIPRFQPGGGWAQYNGGSATRPQSSDSGTERGPRSVSRSEPSSDARTRHSRDNGRQTPEDRISVSAESTPEAAPPIPYWSAKRHLTCGNPTPGPPWSSKNIAWRGSAPGKLKTANAALVLCLNIDVDPPDVVKTNPCAVLECWVDPHTMPSHKALEAIGSNLQRQFEGLSLKISYKPILDPSLEDLRRFCQTLRKQAKDDAVLFYYNGHGVPKPTPSGELWCFNRNYTQYIPVSLQEVQGWLGSPGVYIWDCSAAGHLLNNFNTYAERRDHEVEVVHGGYPEGVQPMMNSLQLAACAANETLPTCPDLPADVFTSCLTSPIDIALRYFVMNHTLPNNVTSDMVMRLPGDLKDRRTPLGELNWIFTAITDTIAWTTFSRETFTRLYRCDLLIASLFRNFLLAERIMKNYNCTPHTSPPLPPTNTHPLWATWDLAVDTVLRQLPDLLNKPPGNGTPSTVTNIGTTPGRIGSSNKADPTPLPKPTTEKPYTPSRFFADQLTAFEVWISRGGSALTKKGPLSLPGANDKQNDSSETTGNESYEGAENHLVPRKPPDQLPIVLQVLLSQPHRLRALILLSQFVDLGPWAVHLVLTIGIFPYISKLLQAAGQDLRPVLIFIWARILAVDSSVQTDLYNSQGYRYFSTILALRNEDNLPNSSEHKAMCSFILASVCRDFRPGQLACVEERVFENCSRRLDEPDFLLRQWTALCIAQMWDGNDEIKERGVDQGTQDKLIELLSDDSAEVRSAAMYALGTFMGASGSADPTKRGGGGTGTMNALEEEETHFRMEVAVVTGATLAVKDDASPMCRKELLVLISCLVKEWRGYFVVCAWIYWEEDRRWRTGSWVHPSNTTLYDEDIASQAVSEWLDGFGDDEALREENRVLLTSFFTIFVALLDLSVDPYQEVATNAQTIVDYIMALLLESPFTKIDSTSLNVPPTQPNEHRGQHGAGSPSIGTRSRVSSLQSSPSFAAAPVSPSIERPQMLRTDTMTSAISNTLKRSTSVANILKSITNGISFPTSGGSFAGSEDGRASPGGLSVRFSSTTRTNDGPRMDLSRPPSPHMNVAQYASPYAAPLEESRLPASPEEAPSHDFTPCHVMEALMEEDMERLRARRRGGNSYRRHHGHYAHGASLPSPSNSTFSMDSSGSIMMGLGTGKGIRDVLPLKSTFYDWCAEYFKEPQMRQMEADEPGSVAYTYQEWRHQRNEEVTRETVAQSALAENRRWDKPISTFMATGYPLTMRFHMFDSHLLIANETDMIGVWDWTKRKRLNYFCNGNAKGTTITSMEIINQDVGGIIVVGSSDSVVRLYRNYDPTLEQGPLQMVSAFRALGETVQTRQGSGLIMDWKQSAGNLLVGGDSRVIKVWDAQTEVQGYDLATDSESPVTSLMSDPSSSQTFIASFADGTVKLFDHRLDDHNPIVRVYTDHMSWVQNARWHPKYSAQFMSGSLDGQVKLFDLRSADQAIETWKPHKTGLASFDVHNNSGVFASTSSIDPVYYRSQRVAVNPVLNSSTPMLTAFNISTGLSVYPLRPFPSPSIPRSSSLLFHPAEMVYAVGSCDGTIRVMGAKLTNN